MLTGKTISQLNLMSTPTPDTAIPVELTGSTYHITYSSIEGSINNAITEFAGNLENLLNDYSSSVATTTNDLSGSFSSSIDSLSGSIATTDKNQENRLDTIESRYATTGSNEFYGDQYISGALYFNDGSNSAIIGLAPIISGSGFPLYENISQDLVIGTTSSDITLLTYLYNSENEGDVAEVSLTRSGSLDVFANMNVSGSVIIGLGGLEQENPEKLKVRNSGSINVARFYGNTEAYAQINLKNLNSGNNASADIVVTADNGNEGIHYVDLGINSSTYSGGLVGYENDAYLLNVGNDLYVGTIGGGSHPSDLRLFAQNNWETPQITISGSKQIMFNTSSVSQGYQYEFSGSVKLDNNLLVQGNQSISGSLGINSNSGSWNFAQNGTLTLPNGAGIYGDGLLQIDAIGGLKLNSYTNEFGSGSQYWYFHTDGTLNVPGNIYGAENLATTASLNDLSSSIATTDLNQKNRLDGIEGVSGSYAITGSNTFNGNQIISGSVTITQNLNVIGSSSITYISQSVLQIESNKITVNANNPSVRFGGLSVIDSGSNPQVSGSLFFDSVENQWIYVHQNTAVVTSSLLIMGPETYNNIGSETHPTTNRIMKSVNDEHIGDSNISDDGNKVVINSNTEITGTIKATGTSLVSGSSQISYTGLSNIPSGIVSGSSQVLNASGVWSGSAQLPSGIISGSSPLPSGIISGSAQVISSLPAGTVSGSSQVLNGSGVWSGSAQLPSGTVSGSSQINITGTTGYSTFSSSISTSIGSLSSSMTTTNNTQNGRLNSLEADSGSYATTGSNRFNGNQTITGSLTITQNVTVNNTSRFGGILVIDSGSNPRNSGSLYYDSLNNQWITVQSNTVTSGGGEGGGTTTTVVTSSLVLFGPQTFNSVGNETDLTLNKLPRYDKDGHLVDSDITDNGSKISINSNTEITGTLKVTGTSLVSGSSQLTSSFDTRYALSGSSSLPSGLVSGSSQINITGTTGYSTFSSSINTAISNLPKLDVYDSSNITGASGTTVNHDYLSGSIFYHSGSLGNFTPNILNLPTTNNQFYEVTLIVNQGNTARIPNALKIAGTTQTVQWQNGVTPTGSANHVDIIEFKLLRSGNAWPIITGELKTYN